MRKKEGLSKDEIINLKISTEKVLEGMLEKHIKFLKERINADEIEFTEGLTKKTAEFLIRGKKISIVFL